MSDINNLGGKLMSCCNVSFASQGMRQYLTKEEKVQMLTEYKEALESEIKGVSERIQELSN